MKTIMCDHGIELEERYIKCEFEFVDKLRTLYVEDCRTYDGYSVSMFRKEETSCE